MSNDLFQNLVVDAAANPTMVRDLISIASLDEATAQNIAQHLAGLDDPCLHEVAVHADSQNVTASIVRVLGNLTANVVPEFLDQFEVGVQHNHLGEATFTADILKQLRINLSILVADYPSMDPGRLAQARSNRSSLTLSRDSQSAFWKSEAKSTELAWVHSADELLAKLEDASTGDSDRDAAVLFAEIAEFDDSQIPRLLVCLANFIAVNRFASDRDKVTSLGAAIRKYAMNMDEGQFESYSEWLAPSQTETLSHRVELELVKGACWRVTYESFDTRQEYPRLTNALFEVARDYLTTRLILQKNYASTALHAIVAVVILQSVSESREGAESLLAQVSSLHMPWFSELLEDRLAEHVEAISKHHAELAESVKAMAVSVE